jgi:putative endonuclease
MSPLKYLYVYILECSDKSFYTGLTNNPEKRLEQHNLAINRRSYTASRLPVRMIYCERFADFELAIKWEKRIKDWNRRKKIALINENWGQLKIAAECKNITSHKLTNPAHILDSARIDNRTHSE